MKNWKNLSFSFFVLFVLFASLACPSKSQSHISSELISSDYPSDLDVPILANSTLLKGKTGFAVQDNPFAIIPIDTTINPPVLASTFPITSLSTIKPAGGKLFGNDLFIANEFMGAVCYSGNDSGGTHITGVAIFNPSTGQILANVNCRLNVGTTYKTLDYTKSTNAVSYRVVSNFVTSYASGVVILGNSLYVCTSNLDTSNFSTYYPSTILVFDLSTLPLQPTFVKTIFPSQDGLDPLIRYYNSTQLTLYGSKILVTNSGATEFNSSFMSVVKSNGSIDVIESTTNTVSKSIALGLAGISSEELKIYNDGTKDIGVMGSQVFGRLYRVNLTANTSLNNATNPVVLNGKTSNEITSVAVSLDKKYYFVSSQSDNKLYVLDVASINTTPGTPKKVKTADPLTNITTKSLPSNMEILPPSGGKERALYTTGKPGSVQIMTGL